ALRTRTPFGSPWRGRCPRRPVGLSRRSRQSPSSRGRSERLSRLFRRTPLFVRQFVPWSSTSVSSAALECDRHVRSPPGLVHEGDDVAIRERLPFEPGDRSIGPPAVVRHGGAVQAPQVLDPAATLPILQDPRVMLRQVPFRIQDPDLGRAPEALLRATLVAQLVVPADLHLPLDLALLPEHDEMRKPEGLLGPSCDCLGHVLRGRKAFLWIEGHRLGHHVAESLRDARHEIFKGSIDFCLLSRELFHLVLCFLSYQYVSVPRTTIV